jgi:hypothetical protein
LPNATPHAECIQPLSVGRIGTHASQPDRVGTRRQLGGGTLRIADGECWGQLDSPPLTGRPVAVGQIALGGDLQPPQQRSKLRVIPVWGLHISQEHVHCGVVEHIRVCPPSPAALQPFYQRHEQQGSELRTGHAVTGDQAFMCCQDQVGQLRLSRVRISLAAHTSSSGSEPKVRPLAFVALEREATSHPVRSLANR